MAVDNVHVAVNLPFGQDGKVMEICWVVGVMANVLTYEPTVAGVVGSAHVAANPIFVANNPAANNAAKILTFIFIISLSLFVVP